MCGRSGSGTENVGEGETYNREIPFWCMRVMDWLARSSDMRQSSHMALHRRRFDNLAE